MYSVFIHIYTHILFINEKYIFFLSVYIKLNFIKKKHVVIL